MSSSILVPSFPVMGIAGLEYPTSFVDSHDVYFADWFAKTWNATP